MNPYEFFSDKIRADQAFLEYNSTLHGISAHDDIRMSGEDHRLWLYAANGDRIFMETIPKEDEDQLKLLRKATGAVYEYTKNQNDRSGDAISRAISAYAAIHGFDSARDFEETMQLLLRDLRQRCEAEGFDFDALSQQSPSLRV
jgi:hypothetical protein